MERVYFTFYRSFFESIAALQTNRERYQAYKMICEYGLNHVEPDLDAMRPIPATLFSLVKPILDGNYIRALKRAKLRAIGEGKTDIVLSELKLDRRADEEFLGL